MSTAHRLDPALRPVAWLVAAVALLVFLLGMFVGWATAADRLVSEERTLDLDTLFVRATEAGGTYVDLATNQAGSFAPSTLRISTTAATITLPTRQVVQCPYRLKDAVTEHGRIVTTSPDGSTTVAYRLLQVAVACVVRGPGHHKTVATGTLTTGRTVYTLSGKD